MAPSPVSERPRMTAWETTSVRFAMFPVDHDLSEAPRWFTAITHTEPAEDLLKRAEGTRTLSGPFIGGTFRVEAQAGRCQLRLSPSGVSDVPPALGPSPSVWASFATALLPFFARPDAPAVTRVAFGAECVIRVDKREQAYLLLHALLPTVSFDPDNTLDLLFQINRPKSATSVSFSATINRLCKWYASVYSAIPLTPLPSPRPSPVFTANLDLDMSTTTDRHEELPREDIVCLLRELMDVAREILSEGDRP